eukprot:2539735-Pleurochrysis_carterae.AAC.1
MSRVGEQQGKRNDGCSPLAASLFHTCRTLLMNVWRPWLLFDTVESGHRPRHQLSLSNEAAP